MPRNRLVASTSLVVLFMGAVGMNVLVGPRHLPPRQVVRDAGPHRHLSLSSFHPPFGGGDRALFSAANHSRVSALMVADRWFPSSRLCRVCDTVHAGLRLGACVLWYDGCNHGAQDRVVRQEER